MKIRVARERAPERCVWCHGSLEHERTVCNACSATYHPECASKCATLGCRGVLVRRRDGFVRLTLIAVFVSAAIPLVLVAVVTSAELRAFLSSCSILSLMGIFPVFLLAAARQQRTDFVPARPRERPVEPPLAEPAPVAPSDELKLPARFASHPIETGKTTGEDALEQRLHQREALADRKPPGLGKTI